MKNPNGSTGTKHGKWSIPGIPHKGWVCVDREDLGKGNSRTCEMCESQEIRRVHYMEHPKYSGPLRVGCDCAGRMEESPARARAREDAMKNRAAKRKRWTSRSWKTSEKGNQYINADGYRVTVYPHGSRWKASVARVGTREVTNSHSIFQTMEEAKLAAFDYITKLLARATKQTR